VRPKALRKLGAAHFPLTRPMWPSSVPRPPKRRKVGLEYDTTWSRRYPARLVRAILTDNVTVPLTRFVAPAIIEGGAALERMQGPVIIASNHASHADTGVLIAALPLHLRHKVVVAAASDYFFDTPLKATMASLVLGAIPIERTKVSRRSAASALALLADGWSVIIYPEGGRTHDGWMRDFKSGAAFLSVRSGAPVIPVYLEGTARVLPKRPVEKGDAPGGSGSESTASGRIRRAPVTVLIGRALRPTADEDARGFGPRIEAAVAELGREASTDYWTARRSPDAALTYGPEAAAWRRSWALPAPRRVTERQPLPDWPTQS